MSNRYRQAALLLGGVLLVEIGAASYLSAIHLPSGKLEDYAQAVQNLDRMKAEMRCIREAKNTDPDLVSVWDALLKNQPSGLIMMDVSVGMGKGEGDDTARTLTVPITLTVLAPQEQIIQSYRANLNRDAFFQDVSIESMATRQDGQKEARLSIRRVRTWTF